MKTNQSQKNNHADWKHVRLGELYTITSSKRVFQNEWTDEGVPFYRAREVAKLSENGFVENDLFISRNMFEEYKAKYGVPQKDDLLITGVGTVGMVYRVVDNREFYFKDGNIIWLKSKGLASSAFIEQLYKSPITKNKLLGSSPITTVATYTIDAAKKAVVHLPPLAEQNRIVSILETWDKAIEKLSKKIEAKKLVKHCLMRDLLTRKKCLSGFKNKWQTVEIGELLDYEQPTKYIVNNTDYGDEYDIPVLTANKGFILGYTNEQDGVYTKTPAIIFDDFTMDNKFVDFDFKVKSSAIKILTPKNESVNLKFVFERMQLMNVVIGEHRRHYLSEYQYLTINVPDIREQNAIEKMLTTADTEIKELEKKLQIIKDQKKYLLNNLITGTIRTPEKLSKI